MQKFYQIFSSTPAKKFILRASKTLLLHALGQVLTHYRHFAFRNVRRNLLVDE